MISFSKSAVLGVSLLTVILLASCGEDSSTTTSSANYSDTPLTVVGLESGVTKVVSGEAHSCVLLDSGGVQCFGSRGYQTGVEEVFGSDASWTSAMTPNFPSGVTFTDVTVGDGTSFATASDGTVYAFGADEHNGLAVGSSNRFVGTPTQITDISGTISAVAGWDTTCAVTDGAVQCLGDIGYFVLGYVPSDTCDNIFNNATANCSLSANAVSGLSGTPTALYVHENNACTLIAGEVYCWGRDDYGQLGALGGEACEMGNNSAVACDYAPQKIATLANVTDVAIGFQHICALVDDGTVWCWGGENRYSELGITHDGGSYIVRPRPAKIDGLTSVTDVTAGRNHVCVVDNGAAKCWGINTAGQLGAASSGSCNVGEACSPTPVTVTGLDSGVTSISSGGTYTCAVHNGAVKCWGANDLGQLGADPTTTAK